MPCASLHHATAANAEVEPNKQNPEYEYYDEQDVGDAEYYE